MRGDVIQRQATGIVDLRDDQGARAEELSERAHEAKLLIIWDQDTDARETLERHGLASFGEVVAGLAARDEIEGGHYDNARRIAIRHGVDLVGIARHVALRLTRDGYGDQADELARRFELDLTAAAKIAGTIEGQLHQIVGELSAAEEQRAAALACDHLLRVGDYDRVASIASDHDLLNAFRERLSQEVGRLMQVTGGHAPTFDIANAERASRLAAACGLEGVFRERAQEVAARALVHAIIRDETSEISATDFAWRTCAMDDAALRRLAPVGLLLSVAPPGFHEETLALARQREELIDDDVIETASAALLTYLDREQSPRALSELAGVARSFGEEKLAWRAVDKAYERSMALKRELEPADAATELESCLELVAAFDVGGERTRKVAAACARLWLLVEPQRSAEIAREHGLKALMREAAAKHLRAQLDTIDLDGAERTAQAFDLRRERVAEVAIEAVEAKVDRGELLDAIGLSRAQGVGEELVRSAALELVDRVGDESRHEELERTLEISLAAGLTEEAQEIAGRLFRQRYQFTRMMPSYRFLLETIRFAIEHGVNRPVEGGVSTDEGAAGEEPTGSGELDGAHEDLEEGLVRLLAYHAGHDTLDRFATLAEELGLSEERLEQVVEGYFSRITSEQAPWHIAVVRVARAFDRAAWLVDSVDEIVENALVHGNLEHAEVLSREYGDEVLHSVVERFQGLIES